MPYLSFLFICFMWGTSFIMIDRAAHAFGPLAIGAGRLLGGALTLAIYWAYTREPAAISKRDWWNIALVAGLANAWPFTVLPYVMSQAKEHGYFGMLVTLVPLVTIITAIPMLGVWPSTRQVIGVVGGLICLVGVSVDGSQRGIPWGLLALGLTVPLTYALGNTYIKWKLDHLHPLPLTVLFLAMGGLMLLSPYAFPETMVALNLQGPAEPYDWTLAIGSLTLLAIFSTGLAILLFMNLVKYQGPLFAGMVTYVIPLVALAWGQFDNEKLTPLQLGAMGGVLAMVALVQWRAAGDKDVKNELPGPLLD